MNIAPDFGRLEATVRRVIEMLVACDYVGLERLNQGEPLHASELERAVRDYGARVVMPAVSLTDCIDWIAIDESDPQEWSVDVIVWCEGEGRSDLTLQLTLADTSSAQYAVTIDDLHVL